jgi:hypothetical protein
VTAWYVAIPVVAIVGTLLVLFSRMVARHNAARAHGRHENGHTVHHDGPPLTARRLPAAGALADAYASLATPCPRCKVDHIGDCPPWGPAALPGHPAASMIPVALPLEPLPPAKPVPVWPLKLTLEPVPDEHRDCREVGGCGPDCPWCAYPELLPAELTGEEAAALRERFYEAVKGKPAPFTLPPGPPLPDLTIVTDDTITPADVDQAYQDALAINQPAVVEPTTGEIFEHLHEGDRCWCLPWKPAPLLQAVVDELNGHTSIDEAIESMFTRAQADQVIALTNGQVTSDA